MIEKESYDDHVIRLFLMAAAVWGVVGMSIGVFAAAQMAWPALNFDVSWLTFSRIRANHTFGVIFAFGGCALMGTKSSRQRKLDLANASTCSRARSRWTPSSMI